MARHFLMLIILFALVFTPGCTSIHDTLGPFANETPELSQIPSVGLNRTTLAQPDNNARFIHMATDLYSAGDVIDFTVVNDGHSDLRSPNDNPSFSVVFQTGSGSWATRMGTEQPVISNASRLKPGQSSKLYSFLSEGWEPGRYRIISDYGVKRDFLIRATPQPTPSTTCAPAGNSTRFITIDEIPVHAASEQFSITGKTNIPAGSVLKYEVFAVGPGNSLIVLGEPVPLRVVGGVCGNNTWSVNVMLPEPAVYVIGITYENRSDLVLRRFTIVNPQDTLHQGTPERTQPLPTLVPPTPQMDRADIR